MSYSDYCFIPAHFRDDPRYTLPPEERAEIIRDYYHKISDYEQALSEQKPVLAADILISQKITEWLFGYPQEGEYAGL